MAKCKSSPPKCQRQSSRRGTGNGLQILAAKKQAAVKKQTSKRTVWHWQLAQRTSDTLQQNASLTTTNWAITNGLDPTFCTITPPVGCLFFG